MNNKDFYYIGCRDTVASILAMYFNKIKLKELSEEYRKQTQEEHFSHKWHTDE